MTLDEYQRLASRTVNWNLADDEMELHALHGMASEVGEIHGLFQKVYQGHKIDVMHLKKEIGDLMWFVAEMCTANNWNLDDVCDMNISKLKARYPIGFDADRSKHRAEGDV